MGRTLLCDGALGQCFSYGFRNKMGVYLSSPKTDKFSEDGENDSLRYGLSSMQGWRATMEDAVSTTSCSWSKFICFIDDWSSDYISEVFGFCFFKIC